MEDQAITSYRNRKLENCYASKRTNRERERIQADPLNGHLEVVRPRGDLVIAKDAQMSVKADSVTLEVGRQGDRRNFKLNTSIVFTISTMGDDGQVVWRRAPCPHDPGRPVPDARIGDYRGEIWIQLDQGVSLIPSQAVEQLTFKG